MPILFIEKKKNLLYVEFWNIYCVDVTAAYKNIDIMSALHLGLSF
jgi:hypothetical protein